MSNRNIYYSEKYYDDTNEYRHVHLPKEIAKKVPKNRLMTEYEWRELGIQQSAGWVHYMIHEPEPHIILFRRPRTDIPTASTVQPNGQDAGAASLKA
ncbi:cyclin-dependent kinase regulatory subunit CKS1 [Paragonimus westermani]|uniref:Cyclin-dependent kinases regulatory subunit n=1 Tax=Paragonimus westermani TaxID=34504 RepID=A0A5J4N7U1_9TREM|nr:cyclin-dependent kinase regulatory subunit CKS1 [Paragonimus westermani]